MVAVARGHEILVLGMAVDVVRDEGAERNDLEALSTRVFERGRRQPAAEAASRARFVDLGVRERDAVPSAVVRGFSDHSLAEPQLVPRGVRNVDDERLVRRGGHRLRRLARPEVPDELSGRIGLARGAVVEEAPPMRLGVLPRLELLQVPVDRACAAEEAAVLRFEGRDLVGPGDRAQAVSLLRPGLDLAGDEVEAELGEDLADGRRERAPLGLVERQQPQPSKPFVLCVPSQNGLFFEPPQRQSAARSPS